MYMLIYICVYLELKPYFRDLISRLSYVLFLRNSKYDRCYLVQHYTTSTGIFKMLKVLNVQSTKYKITKGCSPKILEMVF